MIGVSLNNYLSIYKAIIDFRFAIKQVDDICFSAHLQSSVFKLSKDLIDSIHEEGIVAYTS